LQDTKSVITRYNSESIGVLNIYQIMLLKMKKCRRSYKFGWCKFIKKNKSVMCNIDPPFRYAFNCMIHSEYFWKVKLHLKSFRCLNKLNYFVKEPKDKTEFISKNNVVYKIVKLWYFLRRAETTQTGMIEYVNNMKLDSSRHSIITEHILKLNYSFDCENKNIRFVI